jgi:two-component system, OmpR family, phosphate regulon sensor histidine kinase PhoR
VRRIDPAEKNPANTRARTTESASGRRQQTNALDAVLREDLNGFDISALFDQFADHDYRGMLVINPRRQVLAMNPVSRELLSFDEALPRSVASVVHDPHFEFAVGDALHDRHPAWHETYVPNPDRLLRFHIVPVTSDAGEPQVLVVSVEDATRLRHLETVRKDFVANVSHELRTPIASINLLVETLQRGAMNDPDAAMHFLHRIQVETHAMAQLVEELLELSRLETGGLSLNTEDFSIEDLLAEVRTRLLPAGEEKGVAIHLDVQNALPSVRADAKRIEQIVMNLLHNAIKFTPSGGSITLRASRQGRGAQLDVVDTGVGMDAAEAERIFERFYKVDKGRSRVSGAGLGLAIARHLLELHGSQLQVVSEVGRGSRFSFALPLAD